MSAAVIFLMVRNVVVLKGSSQLTSRVEINNFASSTFRAIQISRLESRRSAQVKHFIGVEPHQDPEQICPYCLRPDLFSCYLDEYLQGSRTAAITSVIWREDGDPSKGSMFLFPVLFCSIPGGGKTWTTMPLLNEMFLRQKASLLVHKYYSTQALC